MIEFFVPITARTKNVIGKVGFVENLPKNLKMEGKLKATITCYFSGQATGDIDNLQKPILDLMKGVLYDDDSQIKEVHMQLEEFSAHRTGIEIKLERRISNGPRKLKIYWNVEPSFYANTN